MSGIIDKAVDAARRVAETELLYLCGYSRGGHIAIRVAEIIKPRPVEALFLFDAVKRSISGDSDRISSNVKRVCHALRDPSFTQKEMKSTKESLDTANRIYDQARGKLYSAFFGPDPKIMAPVLKNINSHAISRNANYNARNETGLSVSNFGNTGLEADAGTKVEPYYVSGSHGALGGVPWPEQDVKGDSVASLEVQAWMWARFAAEKIISK